MAKYDRVNTLWPNPVPVPDQKEAIAGVKRLIRRSFALAKEDRAPTARFGLSYGSYIKTVKFKSTSGNRSTWPRSGVWQVNPNQRDRGWFEIVHSVSHWAYRRFWPQERTKNGGHGTRHVWLEQELAAYAIANFLAGQLKRPEKPKPDVKAVRASRVAARLASWKRKRARADTAIRKLTRQVKHYERALAATQL